MGVVKILMRFPDPKAYICQKCQQKQKSDNSFTIQDLSFLLVLQLLRASLPQPSTKPENLWFPTLKRPQTQSQSHGDPSHGNFPSSALPVLWLVPLSPETGELDPFPKILHSQLSLIKVASFSKDQHSLLLQALLFLESQKNCINKVANFTKCSNSSDFPNSGLETSTGKLVDICESQSGVEVKF